GDDQRAAAVVGGAGQHARRAGERRSRGRLERQRGERDADALGQRPAGGGRRGGERVGRGGVLAQQQRGEPLAAREVAPQRLRLLGGEPLDRRDRERVDGREHLAAEREDVGRGQLVAARQRLGGLPHRQ